MIKNLFSGVATALVTPMNDDFTVDYSSYEDLVSFQLENDIDGLIVAGTTGEGSTLTMEEKIELLKRTLALRGDRKCTVILGTGSNNTLTAIEQTKLAEEFGADAALVVTPYYNKTSQRGLVAHYYAIANSVNIPIILYNVPGRTGMTIEPETVAILAEHKNIVGLKDATGNMKYMDNVRRALNGADFKLYSGDDGTFFDFLSHGGDGVISVLSNCLPKSFKEIYTLVENGEYNFAGNIQLTLNPFISALFSDVSPTPVKAVLNFMEICRENVRLPLVPITDDVKERLIQTYKPCLEIEIGL